MRTKFVCINFQGDWRDLVTINCIECIKYDNNVIGPVYHKNLSYGICLLNLFYNSVDIAIDP